MQTAPETTQKTAKAEEAALPGTARETTGKKKKTVGQEILSWVFSFAVALAAALLIRAFLFTLITVDGTSIMETLQDGDRLYVSVLSARLGGYEHGDVVICQYPGRKDYIVKRVIGLPGDTVSVSHGQPYVNGEPVEQPYVTHPNPYNYDEITLEEGQYFVLGDNRSVSHDSHSADVGPVTKIIGKVRAIFWPLNRIGRVH